MSRILLLAIAVLVLFWLLRRALSGRKGGGKAADRGPPPAPELVACARCGVHLPKNEATLRVGQDAGAQQDHFCSEEHARLGRG